LSDAQQHDEAAAYCADDIAVDIDGSPGDALDDGLQGAVLAGGCGFGRLLRRLAGRLRVLGRGGIDSKVLPAVRHSFVAVATVRVAGAAGSAYEAALAIVGDVEAARLEEDRGCVEDASRLAAAAGTTLDSGSIEAFAPLILVTALGASILVRGQT
jgi:hypothetical protein